MRIGVTLLFSWSVAQFRRKIRNALALQRRVEARSDGLELHRLSSKLEISWYARDTHPWDREVSAGSPSARFIEQCAKDAEAALSRLFRTLPEIDVIAATVLDRQSGAVIMEGTVYRSSLEVTAASTRMRLMNWGIRFTSR